MFAPADRCSFLLAAAAVIFKQMEKASENDSEGSERARPGVRHTHFPARMDTHKHTQTYTRTHILGYEWSIRWPTLQRSGRGHLGAAAQPDRIYLFADFCNILKEGAH